MKLELKHVAPYLPYDVQVEWNGNFGQIVGISLQKSGYPLGNPLKVNFPPKHYNVPILYEDTKLVLHPLSRLTEPILDGKIPLIELAKMVRSWSWNLQDGKATSTSGFRFWCNEDSFVFSNPAMHYLALNQLELFQKLFEWHFDVFGLIEKGLAIEKILKNQIDINSLPKLKRL